MRLNEELTYAELCEELNVEKMKSGSKQKQQLKELQLSYDIVIIDNYGERNKYIIQAVYDNEMKEFIKNLNAPVQQLKFEAKLFEACVKSETNCLVLSNTQLLKLLGEVNDNFSYCFDVNNLSRIDNELCFMHYMNKTVYNILYQWTKSKIDSMDRRMLLIKRRCFRLYKKITINDSVIIQTVDVPINSDLEKDCQALWDRALISIDNRYKDKEGELLWMPEQIWLGFEKQVNQMVKEKFNSEYVSVKRVTMFSPPTKEYMIEKLKSHYKQIDELELISRKAQQKVLTTTRLSDFTKEEKCKYIEYNMTDNPPMWFRQELKNKKKK